jgi:hypothetical protein
MFVALDASFHFFCFFLNRHIIPFYEREDNISFQHVSGCNLVVTLSGKDLLGREGQGNGSGGNCWVWAEDGCSRLNGRDYGYEKESDSTAPILLCLVSFVSYIYGSFICYVKICVGLQPSK